MGGCRRKGSNRRWILTSLKCRELRVEQEAAGERGCGRRCSLRTPSAAIAKARNELRPTSECCGGRSLFHYAWGKNISSDIYIYIYSVSRRTTRRSKQTARDNEKTRTANPAVAVVSDVVIFSLSRHGLLFLLFTEVPKSHFADSSATEGAPTNQLFWWMFTRETLRRTARKCR